MLLYFNTITETLTHIADQPQIIGHFFSNYYWPARRHNLVISSVMRKACNSIHTHQFHSHISYLLQQHTFNSSYKTRGFICCAWINYLTWVKIIVWFAIVLTITLDWPPFYLAFFIGHLVLLRLSPYANIAKGQQKLQRWMSVGNTHEGGEEKWKILVKLMRFGNC